jgi:site-specific recombinase XerD
MALQAESTTHRHSFTVLLLQNGRSIYTIKEMLGYKNVKTTMICTHILSMWVQICFPAQNTTLISRAMH